MILIIIVLSPAQSVPEDPIIHYLCKVYDFVVDYTPISSIKKIYNINRYLMTKHNI